MKIRREARIVSWEEIDEYLDHIERNDISSVVEIFEYFERMTLVSKEVDARRQSVNLTSFAKHIGVTRYTLQSWVMAYDRAQSA